MLKTLLFVIAELSQLDKAKAFCGYGPQFVFCQTAPPCHPQSSTETVTFISHINLHIWKENDLRVACESGQLWLILSRLFHPMNLFMTHMHHKSNSHVLTPRQLAGESCLSVWLKQNISPSKPIIGDGIYVCVRKCVSWSLHHQEIPTGGSLRHLIPLQWQCHHCPFRKGWKWAMLLRLKCCHSQIRMSLSTPDHQTYCWFSTSYHVCVMILAWRRVYETLKENSSIVAVVFHSSKLQNISKVLLKLL